MMNQLTNHNAEDYTSSAIQDLLALITPEQQKETDRKMMLALKIFNAMKAKGWNKTKLAKEIIVKNSQVTRWLSGTQDISSTTLWKLGDKLGLVFLPVEEETPKVEIRYRAVVLQTAGSTEPKELAAELMEWSSDDYEPFDLENDPYLTNALLSTNDTVLAEI